MNTVWKVGSRWGNQGDRVLDLFLEYGCVFFGTNDDCRKGHWQELRKGDLFIISDGASPVAVGEALGQCEDYQKSGFAFRQQDTDRIGVTENLVKVGPARIQLLLPNERKENWGIDPRKRFCKAPGAAKKVRKYWEKVVSRQGNGEFDIKSRVVSLASKEDPHRIFQEAVRYAIPIFQRPYSWTEYEIRKLMEDLVQGMINGEQTFMGTLQLSQRVSISADGKQLSFNIIDGQQRLTTLMILLIVLDKFLGRKWWQDFFRSHIRTSVNKRAAQGDLDELFSWLTSRDINGQLNDREAANLYIANSKLAYELVKEFASPDGEKQIDAERDEVFAGFARRLSQYLEDNLKFVIIETQAGLSKTLKIFNTINTAGLDLGAEDVFKVRFYDYLKSSGGCGDEIFDEISEVYEKVEEYNKHPYVDTMLSMGGILSAYQRALVAKYDLSVETFSMSQESFFDQLFDTVSHVHEWPAFRKFSGGLKIADLKFLLDCYIRYLKGCETNPELHIFRHFLWETRYGYVSNFPVLALFFGVIDEDGLETFTKGLFKILFPASVYFQKTLSRGRTQLIELLKAMAKGEFSPDDSLVDWGHKKWFDGNMMTWAEQGLGFEIAWVGKWKNLICKLVEYVQTPEREHDAKLFERLFSARYDIEHIQPYTDENDSDAVWNAWGGDINRVGNLAMFESSLNRGVQNHTERKPEAYAKSAYKSLSMLSDRVRNWSQKAANERGAEIKKQLLLFLSR